jgi:hypothetical protein
LIEGIVVEFVDLKDALGMCAVVVVRAAPLAPPVSMIRWQLSAPPVALLPA